MGKNLKKSRTFRFSDDELELLESVKGDGSYTDAIVRGLQSLRDRDANQPTNKELIEMLKARLG